MRLNCLSLPLRMLESNWDSTPADAGSIPAGGIMHKYNERRQWDPLWELYKAFWWIVSAVAAGITIGYLLFRGLR